MATNKKKRRTELDIAGREKQKDYTGKRINDDERFNESIIKKKSKLNDIGMEEPAYKSRRSSYPQCLDSTINNETSTNKDSIDYTRNRRRTDIYNQRSDVPKGTESFEVKGRPTEQRRLDIGERKHEYKTYKRINDNEKFQNAVVERKSKLKNDSKFESKSNTERRKRRYTDEVNEKKRDGKLTGNESYTYDPLSQDMDNDGIVDRYDYDFRDSDYEESTYDIDGLKKDVKSQNRNLYKKKAINFYQKKTKEQNGKLTTDDVEVLQNGMADLTGVASVGTLVKANDITDSAAKKCLKEEGKRIRKRKRASKLYNKPKYNLVEKNIGKVSTGSFIASEYMSAGSEDNVAIEAVDRGLFTGGSVARHTQNKLQRKRRNPLREEKKFALKHRKHMAKAEYEYNLENIKKTSEYQKKSAYKKLIKRNQMKKKIYQEHNVAISFKDKVKKETADIIKGSSEVFRKNLKGILIGIAFFIIGFLIISQLATMFLGGISTVTSEVISTSYLSDEGTLLEINNDFTSLEYELADELSNIETYYPGYDEYHVYGDSNVGHDIHELLSYITARYGGAENASELNMELRSLFNKAYQVDYETKVETRYKTVCTGEGEDEECHEEAYDWNILNVKVVKKSIDTVAREEFSQYPDNLAHYEVLLETKGNMEYFFGGSGDTPVIPDSKIVGELINDPTLSPKEKALVSAAYRTPTAGEGYCAAWASNVYVNAGFSRPGGNACDQYYWYCKSNDLSKLRPGMMVAVPSHPHSKAGQIYGHVGIYVGNGIIRENIGYVKDTKLSDWIAFYGSSAKWGFPS